MTFFDNHVKTTTNGECRTNCSRGLHVALDTAVYPPTAQLLREFSHPVHLQAQSQGSVQVLDLSESPLYTSSDFGNVFIGWGRCPSFTEHTATGETVLDIQFSPWHSADIPDALDDYRAYKMGWVAEPWWDPAVALAWRQDGEEENGLEDENGATNGTLVVYASWNGATEVAGWVVRGRPGSVTAETEDSDGEDEDEDILLAASPRTGFETELTISFEEVYRYLWAEALDAQGNVLRSSGIIDLNTTSIRTEKHNSSAVYAELGLKSSSSLWNKTKTDAKSNKSHAHARGLSSTAIALLGSGLGALALALIIGSGVLVYIRRRRNVEYKSLEASDFDLGPVDDDYDEEEEEEEEEEVKEAQCDDGVRNRDSEADEGLEQSGVSEDEGRHALLHTHTPDS
jgi:hypothetical protein